MIDVCWLPPSHSQLQNNVTISLSAIFTGIFISHDALISSLLIQLFVRWHHPIYHSLLFESIYALLFSNKLIELTYKWLKKFLPDGILATLTLFERKINCCSVTFEFWKPNILTKICCTLHHSVTLSPMYLNMLKTQYGRNLAHGLAIATYSRVITQNFCS